MDDKPLTWVATEGGPLIVLPQSLIQYWMGCYVRIDDQHQADIETAQGRFVIWSDIDPANPRTDYERACAVDAYAALLPVATGYGLVLGDDPNQTTWWPFSDGSGGVLVRWFCANSEADVLHDLQHLPVFEEQAELTWQIDTDELLLFDAGDFGASLENPHLKIRLNPGTYNITTIPHYGLSEGTSLTLHILKETGNNSATSFCL